MKNILKKLAYLPLLGIALIASAATLQPYQGGTGVATTTLSNVGNFLQVASTSPFLTYTFGTTTISSAGSTTTINGVQGPTFTFSSPSSTLRVSTSTGNIYLDIASLLISQFANDLNFISTTTGSSYFQKIISFPIPIASTSLAITSPIQLNTNTLSLDSNGYVSSTIAGSNITISSATGNVTIAVTSTPSFTTVNGVTPSSWLTKTTNEKSIQWSASYSSSTSVFDDPIFTFYATSTIDKIYVSSRDSANTLTWNFGYSTDPTTASSSAFKLFTSSQVSTSTPGSAFTFTPNASSTPGNGQTLRLFSDTASSSITSFTIWYHEN